MRLLILLLLTACAAPPSYRWAKPGSNHEQFLTERAQCESRALSVPGSGPERVTLVFASCMEAKGWRLVER